MTITDSKIINALQWMLDRGIDVYGDGTGVQFKGNMPWYTVEALHKYFNSNFISNSIDTKTINWNEWNVTLNAGKFKSQQNTLVVCFNRTNEWYAKRELEKQGFTLNEVDRIVSHYITKEKDVIEAFFKLIENGLITPETYEF